MKAGGSLDLLVFKKAFSSEAMKEGVDRHALADCIYSVRCNTGDVALKNDLDDAVLNNDPQYYEEVYLLYILDNSQPDALDKFIRTNANEMQRRNDEARKQPGMQIGYSIDPLQTIRNIITIDAFVPPENTLELLASVILDSLQNPQQTYPRKSQALQLLYVYMKKPLVRLRLLPSFAK